MFWKIIGGVLGGLFSAIAGWFTAAQVRADERKMGKLEEREAQHEADLGAVHAANVAAEKAKEPTDAPDPNDLDAAR